MRHCRRRRLSDHAGQTAQWLSAAGLAGRPRLAAALEVEGGWERAVETVLGDYLEAVCVEELDAAAGSLGGLSAGRLTLHRRQCRWRGRCGGHARRAACADRARSLPASRACLRRPRSAQALQQRAALGDGHSYITAAGEWVGRGVAACQSRQRRARRRARARAPTESAAGQRYGGRHSRHPGAGGARGSACRACGGGE